MKTRLLLFAMLVLWIRPLGAQQFLTLGVGFCGAFYQSSDLERFEKTYNQLYQPHLIQELQGLQQPVGVRFQIGYRRLDRLGFAALAGIQNYTSNDLAQFENRETRKLELKLNNYFLEGEIAHRLNNFFIGGVVSFSFNRKIILKSSYSNPFNQDIPNKSLNGNYRGESSLAADLGVAVGFFRDPILLIGKMTYPVFTAGKAAVLQDSRVEKVADGTNIFPDNYGAFLVRQPYHGVGSNIDGLKILLIVELAIPI